MLKSHLISQRNIIISHHSLLGSASPVLTATGFVNGKGQFSAVYRIDTPQPITKKLSQFITSTTPMTAKLGAYPSTLDFWTHGWNITKIIFIYAPFWKLTYRSDRSTDFHAWWLKRRGLAQGCAFWGFFSHCSPFRGQNPKNHFGTRIGVSKSNSCILSKLVYRFQPNFAQWQRPPNALRGWSRHTHYKFKMAYGRHLGKIVISLLPFERFWHNLALWCSSTLLTVLTVKNLKFQKSKMAAPPSSKI